MTFAIIETGGKQYNVSPGSRVKVEKLAGEPGSPLSFERVLLRAEGGEVRIGTPTVSGARVEGKIIEQGRTRKVIVFKYHSKTRYKKKKGHRQPFTEVEITSIK